jgi:hypothetical protein
MNIIFGAGGFNVIYAAETIAIISIIIFFLYILFSLDLFKKE